MKSFRSLWAIVTALGAAARITTFEAIPTARATQTNVAVAANFTDAAKKIAAAFTKKNGPSRVTELRIDRSALHPDHATRAVPGLSVRR
jgi:hypothetical protein